VDYKLMNVEALWPRIDRPYKYDPSVGERGSSVPADLTDEEASYEITLIIKPEQAKDLAKAMADTAKASGKHKDKVWSPGGLGDLFEKDENCYRVKCNIKTYGDPGTKPVEFMDDGRKAEPGFQLTTGSIVHAMIRIAPWAYAGKIGVGLRPKAFKVVRLAERTGGIQSDPFSDTSSGKSTDDPFDDAIPF